MTKNLLLGTLDIEGYVEQNCVPYVDDSTNSEENYTRNKLRNQIMPLIRQAYGGVDGNVIRLSRLAKEISRAALSSRPARQYSRYLCKTWGYPLRRLRIVSPLFGNRL
mgnify:CR=1 FL=1